MSGQVVHIANILFYSIKLVGPMFNREIIAQRQCANSYYQNYSSFLIGNLQGLKKQEGIFFSSRHST